MASAYTSDQWGVAC